ncbi:YcnI family protein [Microbacterium fluvii]|uniref:YcnI family protein n=1 Tax=Microbacterium fluvii TaxID=415215 RepID=A0ABW2HDV0_9MICO|nr:YcnI family protein [Microbacterium fluvii]MCU4671569.1 YcnI family protein [Microbacterium fluvii]
MHEITPARRRARIALGATAGLALALAAPLAASAHVHVTPDEASAGASTRLTFSFSHGCDDSPTTALVIDMPDTVTNATPVLDGAWTISRELRDDGTTAQVTYTAVNPIESGISASVSLDADIATDAADTSIPFPVTQECVDGETAWTEVAEEGQTEDDLEAPAPVVVIGAVAEATDEHDHGTATAEADEHSEHAEETASASDEASATSDPVARWLAAGGLVAGLAALFVALRRRKV